MDRKPSTSGGHRRVPPGLAVEAAQRWLVDHVADVDPPFEFELIAGGNSNLTYLLTDSGGRKMVLRRPPLHGVLDTAHDMRREWRAITALADTAVPVPSALAFCDDAAISDAPFYVTAFVDGYVLHDIADTASHSTPEGRAGISRSMIESLAALHQLDPDAVGLGRHGRRDGNYIERQLQRWYRHFLATKTTELPDVDRGYELLVARLPADTAHRVVHGDFRLGNCIVSGDGNVLAVVDWEISTLGDPLADLAYLLTTWVRPNDDTAVLSGAASAPTMAEGFADRHELVDLYSELAGGSVGALDYHLAFNHWRYACIAQGVLARQLEGATGDAPTADLDAMAVAIGERAALAITTLAGSSSANRS